VRCGVSEENGTHARVFVEARMFLSCSIWSGKGEETVIKSNLDALIVELKAAEKKSRDALLAEGFDPAYLDQIEAELSAASDREPTPEEKALFQRVYNKILCEEMP